MSKPENTFIASVHRHLPPVDELYRMKNHNQYNGGIADVWYSGFKDLWVEYKFLVVPKRQTTVIDLLKTHVSPLQEEWLYERHSEGRNVWVIVGSKDGGVIFPETSWAELFTAGEFIQRLRSRQDIAAAIRMFCQKGAPP